MTRKAWTCGCLNCIRSNVNSTNNSVLVCSARVPEFEALLAQDHGGLAAFYADAKRLAKLPAAERNAALDALAGRKSDSQAASEK